MSIRFQLLLLGSILLQACSSIPLAEKLSVEEQNSINVHANVNAALVCNQPADYPKEACDYATKEMEELLGKTGWISNFEASPENADLVITFGLPNRRPYYTTPAHNPAFALLAFAIPFWWSDNFGYRFEATCTRCSLNTTIDTEREGTIVWWGFSSLINISPNRALQNDHERELEHIKLQLLPLIQAINKNA
ncbi:hypothetical protein [Shewanella cyperi]|uniref:hypothetical protein n=1 Tax=Shewanella cyperi TaxID=2814292 RepID=UPI001A93B793|nr:hypothetical protein [Shewanella cyperi]QSX39312.1 hypothetical protein JYB84_09560 [Shewanella cyperi]